MFRFFRWVPFGKGAERAAADAPQTPWSLPRRKAAPAKTFKPLKAHKGKREELHKVSRRTLGT